MLAAEFPAPDEGTLSQATDAVIALREHGVGLFAITAAQAPRAHRDSLGMALHLQQHAGVEAIVTMTTWDKTIMTLQADLLGAHALGIRNVICEAGNPPVLGDYPAVDGIWEVDSLGLVALLAGLNTGRDLDGLPLSHEDLVLHRDPDQPGGGGRRGGDRPGPGRSARGCAVPGHPAGLRAGHAAPA